MSISTEELAGETHAKVFRWLENTPYSSSSLEPLTGGQTNFVYRARLLKQLDDGSFNVIVKHGEPYMARHPANAIATTRCDVEAQCLQRPSPTELVSHNNSAAYFRIRTPKLYMYDEITKTQVQEYLPRALNLKEYALKSFPTPTPETLRPHAHQLGKLLAEFISTFNKTVKEEWHARSGNDVEPQLGLFATLKDNENMQKLKHVINYDWMIQRIDQFPEILEKHRQTFVQVKEQALKELESAPKDLDALHGDWCPNNILLSNASSEVGKGISVLAVDWENAQLGVESGDHGEMLGELYALWFYRRMDARLWLFKGYAEGLRARSESSVWKIVLRIGVHLLAFGTLAPGTGTPEQVQDLAYIGGEMVSKAWSRDRHWVEKNDLSCLFANCKED